MKHIYKYPLVVGENNIIMPAGSKVLSIGVQGVDDLVAWAEVDPTTKHSDMKIVHMIMTGQQVPENSRFLNTILLYNGSFVLHGYEQV